MSQIPHNFALVGKAAVEGLVALLDEIRRLSPRTWAIMFLIAAVIASIPLIVR